MVDPLNLTLDEGLALLERYPDLNDINDAAYALCVIVCIHWSKFSKVMNDLFLSEEPCLEALSRESGLYDTLKQAHASKSYERVVNSSAY
jgi:hypothetical protein